jgi:hypothetical protein
MPSDIGRHRTTFICSDDRVPGVSAILRDRKVPSSTLVLKCEHSCYSVLCVSAYQPGWSIGNALDL